MSLSPWPDAGTERDAAIEFLRKSVAGRTDASDDAANHLGQTASARVERYAPGAPQAVRDEAVIRLAGYLAGADYGGILSETTVGSATLTHAPNHADAFRRSGAAGLLAPWRVRRAGVIEGS